MNNKTTEKVTPSLEGALAFKRQGYRLFPVRHGEKIPAVEKWQDWAESKTEKDMLEFEKANHNCNWGLYAGGSNLIVIDVDNKNGKNGTESLNQWQLDNEVRLPKTYTVRTPSGGYHLYYYGQCKSGANVLGDGVDIRSRGGYVVAPGSEVEGSFYEVVNNMPIVDMPDNIVKLLKKLKKGKELCSDPDLTIDNGFDQGGREDGMASLGGILRAHGFSEDTILVTLMHINEKNNPPLSDAEINRITHSVSQYSPNVARAKTDFNPLIQTAQMELLQMSTVESKMIDWLWPNVFPANMLSMLVGNPGVGKSFLTMEIAAIITQGRDWPGADPLAPKAKVGSVIIFSSEESPEYAIKPRLEAHGADCSKVYFFETIKLEDGKEDPVFNISEHITTLENKVKDIPDLRLIILDPISSFIGDTNENKNTEVRQVLNRLVDFAEKHKVTTLGISHLSKKSDLDLVYRALGSMAFTALARAVWAVAFEKVDPESEQKPNRAFGPVKSNYSIDPDTYLFDIDEGRIVFDQAPSSISIEQMFQSTGGRKAEKLNTATDWIKTRLAEGPVPSKTLEEEAKAAGITKSTLRKAGEKLCVIKIREDGCWISRLPSKEPPRVVESGFIKELSLDEMLK